MRDLAVVEHIFARFRRAERTREKLACRYVYKIHSTRCNDRGNSTIRRGGEPVCGARGESESEHILRDDLMRRKIEACLHLPIRNQLLHAASADARGVERDYASAIAFQQANRADHAVVCCAHHARRDHRAITRERMSAKSNHAHHGGCGVGQNRLCQRIQSRNIRNRRHDRNILVPDQQLKRTIATGHGRENQFRHADGQRAHRGGRHAGVLQSPDAQNAVDIPRCVQARNNRDNACFHDCDRLRASRKAHMFDRAAASHRDFTRGDGSLITVAALCRKIDRQYAEAFLLKHRAKKLHLRLFRIGTGDDSDGLLFCVVAAFHGSILCCHNGVGLVREESGARPEPRSHS